MSWKKNLIGGHSKNILEQFDEPWTLTKMSFEDSSLGNCRFLEKNPWCFTNIVPWKNILEKTIKSLIYSIPLFLEGPKKNILKMIKEFGNNQLLRKISSRKCNVVILKNKSFEFLRPQICWAFEIYTPVISTPGSMLL